MKKRYLGILMIAIILSSFFSAYYLHTDKSIVEDSMPIKENVEIPIKVEEKPIVEQVEEKLTTGTILATGDIMFHTPQIKAAYDPLREVYDFNSVFKYVKEYIESSDLSIGNFETVTGGDDLGFHGFPMFNSPESTILAIKDTGFDILTTANNHSLDQGKEGLINTIDNIENQGMKNIGTYKEQDTPILIEEINEIKLALLSYSYGFNGMEYTLTEEEQSYMINKIDETKIKEDIEKAKGLGTDMVVVFIHWGNEYHREPSEEQMDLGRKMVDWGANIIFGSHPHVIQRSEIIEKNGKDNFIIYSMGNFISNQREESLDNPYTEDGIMVKIELEKDLIKEETIIKNIDYIPTWVRRDNDGNKLNYEILPIDDFLSDEKLKNQLNDNMISRIKKAFQDTMEKMAQY